MIKNKTSLRGFTLLELIVVIAIIGVLSVIILPSFTTALARSRDGRKISELRGMQASLIQWAQNNNGLYPASSTSPASAAACTAAASSGLCALLVSGIEARLPSGVFVGSQSAASSSYNYTGIACYNTYPFLCQSYQLWTNLEQANSALSSDPDASPSNPTPFGASIFNTSGIFTATSGPFMPNGATETCTGAWLTCVFDLVP